MNNSSLLATAVCLAGCLALAGCKGKFDPASGEAQQAQVTPTGDAGLISVQDPSQFPLVAAGRVDTPTKLDVTGSVFPDIDRFRRQNPNFFV